MLERLRKLINEHKDRAAFFKLVGRLFPQGSDEYLLIERAYTTAKDAFRPHQREGGERYFEHLRCVALIVAVHLRVKDANVIAAALLHDIIEDIPGWSHDRVAVEFNRTVAQLVWWVTKPSVELYGGDKAARNRAYHQNLMRAPRVALVVKLADRIHNLLTLWDVDEEKQRRKILETQDFYLPLAEKEILLIHEMEVAIAETMNGWQIPKPSE